MTASANGWARVQLGDVVRQVRDDVDPKSSGLSRYVAGEHMDTDELRISRWGEIGDGYLGPAFHRRFRAGQILYGSRRTYLRKVARADFEGVCANTTLVLESADSQILIPDLLPFIMQTERFHEFSIGKSRGSVNPYVNWSDLTAFPFDLPPLYEQKRLADLLWSLEDVRERWRATQEALRDLSRVSEQREFGATSDRDMVSCRDICDLKVGIVVRPASYYVAEGIPAIRSLNVLPNRLDLSELVYISAESNRLLSKSQLHVGDVVVVRSGRPGDAAAVTPELEGANCIDLIIVRPGPAIQPEYLCRYLNSPVGRSRTHAQSAGTAQQHFNVGALAALLVPVPTITEQETIVQELSAVEQQNRAIDKHLESLRSLQKALKHRFLREQGG